MRGGGGGGGGARGGGGRWGGAAGAVGAAEGGVVGWRAGRYNGPRWPQPISSAALAPARSNAQAARAAVVVRVEVFDMRGNDHGPGGAVAPCCGPGRRRRLRASHWPRSSTAVTTAGITSRLSSVEVISPPITATAIGERKLGSATPRPRAIGSMPAPMASV